ncbi:hypothetical protein ILUMI_20536 [Ignelater luminosus]|uniref:Uncharacterized protein n=1 Tax=Ignelater luminosus TaxID=2038154 RepID=A0A8K0G4G8_IGNLU|nr:hypothetical protein ILUMI_20536 [Ignelater luminosus]
MIQAIEAVRNRTMGYLKASKRHKVSRATLFRDWLPDLTDLLERLTEEKQYSPKQMFNVDECRICTVQSKCPQIIALKGNRQIEALTSSERGALMTVSMFSLFDVGKLFGRAYVRVRSAERAIKVFTTTGSYPTRRSIFNDEDFSDTAHQDENVAPAA